jgi:dolichol-phosphate mannosyltransferase
MASYTIRIMIPIYNEGKNIEECISTIASYLSGRRYKFYVIDGGSVDDSLPILYRLQKKYPIHILHQEKAKGIAEAFRLGIQVCAEEGEPGDVIVLMEGDGTSDPSLLPEMIAKIRGGEDVVIASRYVKGGAYRNFPLRRLVYSTLANMLFRLLFSSKHVTDYTIFYRAYSYTVLKRLCNSHKTTFITSAHFVANTEILLKLLGLTERISEIGLVYDYAKKRGKSGLHVRKNIWQYMLLIARHFSR